MSLVGPFINFLWQLWPGQDAPPFSVLLQRAIRTFFISCLIVAAAQQVSLLVGLYHEQIEEHAQTTQLYAEDCLHYRGRNQALLDDCSRMSIILQTGPVTRALMLWSSQWHSCLYMPCGTVLEIATSNLQYKILLALVGIALLGYGARLFKIKRSLSKQELVAVCEALRPKHAVEAH